MAYPDVQIVLTQVVFDGIPLCTNCLGITHLYHGRQETKPNQTKPNQTKIHSYLLLTSGDSPLVALSCNLPTSPSFTPHNAKAIGNQSLAMADDGFVGFLLSLHFHERENPLLPDG